MPPDRTASPRKHNRTHPQIREIEARARAAPELEVRDKRTDPFARVGKHALQVLAGAHKSPQIAGKPKPGGPALVAVYVALVATSDHRTGEAKPTVDMLADLAGCSRRLVQYKLAELHQLRLVDISETFIGGRQTRSTYDLVDPPLTPPTEPAQRRRLILAPADRGAGGAPLIEVRGAGGAPPRVQEVHPISRNRGSSSMEISKSLTPTRARASQPALDLELAAPPAGPAPAPPERTDGRTDAVPWQLVHPSFKAQIIRDALAKLHGGLARHILPGPLSSARWERHEKRLRITTNDAQCARLARQNAGVIRVSAAELLDCRKLELEINYDADYQELRHV